MPEAISEDDFAILIASEISKSGIDGKSLHIDKNDFAIRRKDDRGNVIATTYLANLYVGYNNATTDEQRQTIVDRTLKLWLIETDLGTYEEIKSRIFPIVRERRSYPEEPTRSIGAGYPQVVISEHLTTLLAVDCDEHIRPLADFDYEHLQVEWGIAFGDAIVNLKNHIDIEWQVYESEDTSGDCVYVYEAEDDYGASILVFPAAIAELEVLGVPIIFTPARNIVVVTGSDCIYGLEHAAEIILECEDRQNMLMPEMLCQDDDLTYFGCDLPIEHPLYETFNKIKLLNNLRVYTQFFKDFEGNFDELVSSKRIVTYEVFEENGAFFSEISLRSEEGPVTLPFADSVRIITPNGELIVTSSAFAEQAADSLVKINEYPLVYELSRPLTAEQLAALVLAAH